jgi:hypothetical protein
MERVYLYNLQRRNMNAVLPPDREWHTVERSAKSEVAKYLFEYNNGRTIEFYKNTGWEFRMQKVQLVQVEVVGV